MTICIDIVPTEICEWNCNYCIFPQIKEQRQTTIEIIDRHLLYIKEIVEILKRNKFIVHLYFQGGEVGTLDELLTEYILKKLDSKITISTNGLFLKKGYHNNPSIRKYIKEIFWHVSPDCKEYNIDDFYDDDIKIIRGIVHNNINTINDYLQKTNLNIEYSEIENSMDITSIINPDIINKCRNYHNDITIDLVNEKLCLCIRNFKSINIPLCRENLIKLLKTFPKDTYSLTNIEDSSCFSCCRLCINRTNNKLYENKVKLIKIFKNLS